MGRPEGGIVQNEMLRIFNCGIGMVVVASSKEAAAVAGAFTNAGETAVTLGSVINASDDARIVYDGNLNLG